MSALDRLRTYFLANIGRILDSEELREVGEISEWARRVRELREDEGFDIVTNNDDAGLKPGQYMLRSMAQTKPRPSFQRGISKRTRAYVLDRNGFTCQMCGAAAGDPSPMDANVRTRLHLGHMIDLNHGGSNEVNNLRALCSSCNEGASDLTLARPSLTHLLSQVRRSTIDEQLELRKWLNTKFRKVQEDPAH